ncbi:MAG: RluA family pseudouridine synthase [Clostridium sp.]
MDSNLIYNVDKCGEGMKVRDYMKEVLELSGRFIKKVGLSNRIKVNDNVVRLNYKLKNGDKLTIQVEKKDESQNIIPQEMDIDVVYEDMDLLIVNKPCNMVVHPTKSYPTGTLSNGVLNYFKKNGENCIVRLVSRLDMDTSGLIMIAKNQFAHMSLAKSMENNLISKNYIAICHNSIKQDEGTINAKIGKSIDDSIKRAVMENGQISITHYKVLERLEDTTVVELKLETGRTHQIRVHLSHLGNPIYGDTLYGKEEPEHIGRQALHAYKLILPHPRTGEIIEIKSEIPDDMKKLLYNLNK